MKKILLGLVAILGISLTGTGCSSGPSKQEVMSANDSLTAVTLQQQSELMDLMGLMADVSSELDKINGQISVANGEEKSDLESRKAELLNKLAAVKNDLEEKTQALEQLTKKYSSVLAQNKQLKSTIEGLQQRVYEYTEKMAAYEARIAAQGDTIQILSENLEETAANLDSLYTENKAQQKIMESQDELLNRAFYIISTRAELKDLGIVTGGALQRSKLTNKGFDTSLFTQVDIRELSEIDLKAKKATVKSNMPTESYDLVTQEDGNLKLVIKDAATFWSQTKFLVIQVR